MYDYEKLGAFYLGRQYDLERRGLEATPILYDAKDLTTHAVIVGMTGSGKTGLGVTLLEEAAIDGIPAIVLDPKGDMGNLLLNFPALEPSDFRPWVERDEAARHGMTEEAYAGQLAQRWRQGLAEWDQPAARVARLGEAAEAVIYTPGSDAGLSLTVLNSLDAPPPEVRQDSELLRERITAATSGLLTLLGIDADPLRSREHILLANILERAWQEGRHLDLAGLIREVQSPPFERIGILDLESTFPASDRQQLALTINNVLAAPGFAAWLSGDPLSAARLLYTPAGKPRLAVVSLAHLDDRQRMFFVTLLLNELIAWMRAQPGTSALRAILYMDEVFGYLPPTANPPSKLPLLTLLKQARAFGLGLVLATQNPVDLDYKALSNAGTWFLGRLQTERDKARVLDGLEGASVAAGLRFSRAQTERILAGLDNRVFLMNNVHEDEPVVFQTRWALSYLRGPLTRQQIQRLMADHKQRRAADVEARSPAAPVRPAAELLEETAPPLLPPEVPQHYARAARGARGARLVYRPALWGAARLHYLDSKASVDLWRKVACIGSCDSEMPRDPWEDAELVDEADLVLESEPLPGAQFAKLPGEMARPKAYDSWARGLKEHLYRTARLQLAHSRTLKIYSRPDQTEGEFRAAVRDEARQQRDLAIEKLRTQYAPKVARLEERMRRAEQRVETEKEQASRATLSAAVSFASSVLAALLGRKLTSTGNLSRAAGSVRAAGRAASQRGDIGRAKENVEALQQELDELNSQLTAEIDQLHASLADDQLELDPYPVRPRKSDITVDDVALLWLPWAVDENGIAQGVWK